MLVNSTKKNNLSTSSLFRELFLFPFLVSANCNVYNVIKCGRFVCYHIPTLSIMRWNYSSQFFIRPSIPITYQFSMQNSSAVSVILDLIICMNCSLRFFHQELFFFDNYLTLLVHHRLQKASLSQSSCLHPLLSCFQ